MKPIPTPALPLKGREKSEAAALPLKGRKKSEAALLSKRRESSAVPRG
jgi:hypothetical protein